MTIPKKKLKELRELTHKKYRDDRKQFIVEGVRFVQEAVDSDYHIIEAYHTKELALAPDGSRLLKRLREKTRNVMEVGAREMELISETVSFQGVLAVMEQKKFSVELLLKQENGSSVIVALDSVSDPGNLGTMLRTCDWFGVDGVLLGKNSVELYNPKVLRATMGGVFHVPIVEDVDLLSTITRARGMGYTVYATDVKGETHFDKVRYSNRCILVFGNEARGVSDQIRELADVRVFIRRYGLGDSLNVSVACGVVLSAMHRL